MVLLLSLVSIPHFPRAGVNCLPSVVFDPNHLTQLSRQLHLISCLNLTGKMPSLSRHPERLQKRLKLRQRFTMTERKARYKKTCQCRFSYQTKKHKITSNYGEASDDFVSTIDYCRLLPRLILTWNSKSNDVEKRPKLATNQLHLAHRRSAFSVVEGPSDVR